MYGTSQGSGTHFLLEMLFQKSIINNKNILNFKNNIPRQVFNENNNVSTNKSIEARKGCESWTLPTKDKEYLSCENLDLEEDN